jgi:hypothetical protein
LSVLEVGSSNCLSCCCRCFPDHVPNHNSGMASLTLYAPLEPATVHLPRRFGHRPAWSCLPLWLRVHTLRTALATICLRLVLSVYLPSSSSSLWSKQCLSCHGVLGLRFAYLGSGLGTDACTALHSVNYVCLSLYWEDNKFRCLEGLCLESLHFYSATSF